METVNIHKVFVSQAVLDRIPVKLVRRYKVLPLAFKDDLLYVAVCPGHGWENAVEQLENITGLMIHPLAADSESTLKRAIDRYYPPLGQHDSMESAAALFDRALNRALQMRASDIHLSPNENGAILKLRVDGHLINDMTLSAGTYSELVTVIKLAAQLDISERRTPLDGNINTPLLGDEVSLRVATIPTLHGEHITLRLLSQDDSGELDTLESLGLSQPHYDLLLRALQEPNGIVLLSGPTGSGKTTTLYAALRRLRTGGKRHLVSIEDPVEKPVLGVTQIKIDADSERMTFNKALRSVLRHDPDVIMIGEIRDSETADIAVKSALTGHLVLSTLHTNSAAGVLTRLINLQVAPFLVVSTLRLAIAQRLVRVPCEHCVTLRRPTVSECELFGWDPKDTALRVPEAKGCSFCAESGYSGRLGLYEMIPVDSNIRKMLLEGGDEHDFADYAFNILGLPGLKQDGAAKILAGKTTVDEVKTVISTVI